MATEIPIEVLENLPDFYQRYLDRVAGGDPVSELTENLSDFSFYRSITGDKIDYAYDEGKWTIRQLIMHLLDAERVFAYRSLWLARNDPTDLPGFDENDWATQAIVDHIPYSDLVDWFELSRKSTITLFESFTAEMLERTGKANGLLFSCRTFGLIIAGHERHHKQVMTERYL